MEPKSIKSAFLPPLLEVIVVCDNWRSCHNVGAMLRTAVRFGVKGFAFVGTTPYPRLDGDGRLPHLVNKQTRAIAKTALGAEAEIDGRHYRSRREFLVAHRQDLDNWLPIEQTDSSQPLADWPGPQNTNQPVWLVLGGEIDGVGEEFLQLGPAWEIPVVGSKKSLNVAVAGGIGLYQLASVWSDWA